MIKAANLFAVQTLQESTDMRETVAYSRWFTWVNCFPSAVVPSNVGDNSARQKKRHGPTGWYMGKLGQFATIQDDVIMERSGMPKMVNSKVQIRNSRFCFCFDGDLFCWEV